MPRWEGFEEIVAIADIGSFVGAARKLAVSSSHISRAVARLEARLGARLFERTTRSVQLTEAGRSLVEQGRRILAECDEAVQFVAQQGEMRGELRMTCSIALGEQFVVPIIHRFMAQHPAIAVTLELTNRIVDLVGEAYDIGIRTGHLNDSRVAARQIATRSTRLCAAPAYLERHGAPTSLAELEQHQCLIGTSTVWHFVAAGERQAFVPAGRWRCNSGAAVVHAALAGMGICQLPSFYVSHHLASGRLVSLLEAFQDTPQPVWAAYPQRRYHVPKVKAMIDALHAQLRDQIP